MSIWESIADRLRSSVPSIVNDNRHLSKYADNHAIRAQQPGERVKVWVSDAGFCKFVAFDPSTKLYFIAHIENRQSINWITGLLKAEEYFGFPILSVQTYNTSEAMGSFHSWLIETGIRHYLRPRNRAWWED